jgi:hypothetical protein
MILAAAWAIFVSKQGWNPVLAVAGVGLATFVALVLLLSVMNGARQTRN